MSRFAVEDVVSQYRRSFHMLYEEIERFSAENWMKGPSYFQRPVIQVWHLLDCLDFYFTDKPDVEYIWGHYFGGGYWELPEEKYPTQAQLLAYACELEARVVKEFAALSDEDLLKPYARGDDATTWLGHYIYAVRHTMHHHGQMAVLLAEQGIEGGSWY